MKSLLSAVAVVILLTVGAHAQCDIGKDLFDEPLPAAPSAPWTFAEADDLFKRLETKAVSSDLVGTWTRVGVVEKLGAAGTLNLGGLDVDAPRGRITVYAPAQGNPFLDRPKIAVQGEGAAAAFEQTAKGVTWGSYSCRLVDADNMLCSAVGGVYLAYSRRR